MSIATSVHSAVDAEVVVQRIAAEADVVSCDGPTQWLYWVLACWGWSTEAAAAERTMLRALTREPSAVSEYRRPDPAISG